MFLDIQNIETAAKCRQKLINCFFINSCNQIILINVSALLFSNGNKGLLKVRFKLKITVHSTHSNNRDQTIHSKSKYLWMSLNAIAFLIYRTLYIGHALKYIC